MRTGKIMLAILFLSAIIGGLMAFKAKRFAVDQMMSVATTSQKTGIDMTVLGAVNSVLFGAGVTHPTSRFVSDFFISTSITQTTTNLTNPANWVPVADCNSADCGSPKEEICCIRIYDPALIYPANYIITAYRNKPKVDVDPLRVGILTAFFTKVEKDDGVDFDVFLRPD